MTSALCCGRNRRGREGTGPTGSRGREQESALVTARLKILLFRAKHFGDLHNRRWLPIKKFNFFIALKTLNENGVENGKQPSRPA